MPSYTTRKLREILVFLMLKNMIVCNRGVNMQKLKIILNLIILILWMALIFNFSSDTGVESTSKSEKFLIKTVELFKHKELSTEEKENLINKYGILIRKAAHMFVYFILAILAFALLYDFFNLKPITVIFTLIFCFIYAITDEVHQLFIMDRAGSIKDVLIDTCGSLIALIIPIIILIKRKIVTNK